MPKILHISDWHCLGEDFPLLLDRGIRAEGIVDPDAVVLTGDMLPNFRIRRHPGEPAMQRQEWAQMIEHIESVWPGADIFAIRGNHDFTDLALPGVYDFDNAEGRSYEWRGMKVWGFRGVTPLYGVWADEYREELLDALCALVPQDTEILITHCPPFGVLDDARAIESTEFPPSNIGSVAIRDLVDRLPNLKYHLFGHCHERGGEIRHIGNKCFSNAACNANLLTIP